MKKVRSGSDIHNWKGGRTISSHGYVLIRVGKGHPLADCRGYAYEHRIVMQKKIGRPLKKSELIHHIDGDRQNNKPGNLELCASIAHHKVEHRTTIGRRMPGERNPMILCKCGCGEKLKKYDSVNRPRKFIGGHGKIGRFKATNQQIKQVEELLRENFPKTVIARTVGIGRGTIYSIIKNMELNNGSTKR